MSIANGGIPLLPLLEDWNEDGSCKLSGMSLSGCEFDGKVEDDKDRMVVPVLVVPHQPPSGDSRNRHTRREDVSVLVRRMLVLWKF